MALNAHAVYASVHMSRREDLLMKGLLMKGLHVQQTGRAMTEHRLAVTQRLIEPWAAPASWRPCSGVGPSHDSELTTGSNVARPRHRHGAAGGWTS